MTTVRRTFVVTPPPQAVIDYLKDFTHAEEWDPGTQRCERLDDGPVQVGSRWHNESKVAAISTELTYELTDLRDDGLVFVGTNDTATSIDSITVVPYGDGSRITYEADIRMHGAARLTAPAVKLVFEKVANDTRRQMAEVLDRLSA